MRQRNVDFDRKCVHVPSKEWTERMDSASFLYIHYCVFYLLLWRNKSLFVRTFHTLQSEVANCVAIVD